MKVIVIIMFFCFYATELVGSDKFPDGTKINEWFENTTVSDIGTLGKKYCITDYGVSTDSNVVQTKKIQSVIDKASENGGGVIVVPSGTFLTGALFFRQGTHLYLEEGAVLKGSDYISDFPVVDTRIEGRNRKYFPAIVNVDSVNGFTLAGKGTINGNGLRYWKAFWLRRKFNPQCTNLDEMRPRVLFVSNSSNVNISGVNMVNSPFWTSHFYRCTNLRLVNLRILAPSSPVGAPSSDAVDIDVCTNVLIKGCYMSVNDDAIALKGGKGPWADKDPCNGANTNVIIEDCRFGFCHSVLTCGSESIHNRNIILRNCMVNGAGKILHLKMRPDTPQNYEYILLENVKGNAGCLIHAWPWTQFFDLEDRKDRPISYASNIVIKNIDIRCGSFLIVKSSKDYKLSDFVFDNLSIECRKSDFDRNAISFKEWKNVRVITSK